MANIASQEKRNRQNEKRRMRNKAVSSEVKTKLRRVDEAIADGSLEAVTEMARQAQRSLGVAARKGVLHRNAVARKQARLARKVASVTMEPADN